MKTMTQTLFLIFTTVLAFAGCATDEANTSSLESAGLCTPGEEMCDYGCYAQHGPSTNDCIIQCNATATAWITITDCGWAQNFPYSSSCLDSRPHPVCQNN